MYFSVLRHKFDFIKCYSLIPRYISHNFQYVLVLEKFPDATPVPKYAVAHKTVPMFCCFGQKDLVWNDDAI